MSEVYKILICGDRHYNDSKKMNRVIEQVKKVHGPARLLIITGGAPGADQMAAFLGMRSDIHVAVVKALWETRYRGAGPQRNQMMLDMEPDLVIAFHPNLKKSKGTADMVRRAKKAGIKVKVYT